MSISRSESINSSVYSETNHSVLSAKLKRSAGKYKSIKVGSSIGARLKDLEEIDFKEEEDEANNSKKKIKKKGITKSQNNKKLPLNTPKKKETVKPTSAVKVNKLAKKRDSIVSVKSDDSDQSDSKTRSLSPTNKPISDNEVQLQKRLSTLNESMKKSKKKELDPQAILRKQKLRNMELPSTLVLQFLKCLSKEKWGDAEKSCKEILKLQPSNTFYKDYLLLLQSLIKCTLICRNIPSRSTSPDFDNNYSDYIETQDENTNSKKNSTDESDGTNSSSQSNTETQADSSTTDSDDDEDDKPIKAVVKKSVTIQDNKKDEESSEIEEDDDDDDVQDGNSKAIPNKPQDPISNKESSNESDSNDD